MTDFERRAGELLRQSAGQLDGATRSRLAQARFAAVRAARRRHGYLAMRGWLPLGGVAAAVLVGVMWGGSWLRTGTSGFEAPPSAQVQGPLEDMELMTADENLEMIEDVEFYAWLDGELEPLIGTG